MGLFTLSNVPDSTQESFGTGKVTGGAGRTLLGIVVATFVLVIAVELLARLVVGSAPLDPRYACAREAKDEELTVFAYGGSSVFGTPIPEWSFIEQFRHVLDTRSESGEFRLCNIAEGGRDSTGVLLDLQRTLIYRPDMIIIFSGHNEFLTRQFETPSIRKMREWAASTGVVRLWNRFVKRMTRGSKRAVAVMPSQLSGFDRDGNDFQARVRRYEDNLTAMVELARSAGTPLLLGTLPANLRDWPPVFRTLEAAAGGVEDEAAVGEMLDSLFEEEYARSEAGLLALSGHDSASAVADYVRGRLALNSAIADARNQLAAAKDADPIPWRALSRFNDHVRSLAAAENDQVYLVDAEQILAQEAEGGAPGFELIADNCHPTAKGNFLIARELLDSVDRSQLVGQLSTHGDSSSPGSVALVDNYDAPGFERFMNSRQNLDSLMLKSHLENAKYSMKVPFYNFHAARMYLREAERLDPQNWKVSANLGALALLDGDAAIGASLIRQSLTQGAAPDDLMSRGSVPYMREALEHAGLNLQEFVEEPR